MNIICFLGIYILLISLSSTQYVEDKVYLTIKPDVITLDRGLDYVTFEISCNVKEHTFSVISSIAISFDRDSNFAKVYIKQLGGRPTLSQSGIFENASIDYNATIDTFSNDAPILVTKFQDVEATNYTGLYTCIVEGNTTVDGNATEVSAHSTAFLAVFYKPEVYLETNNLTNQSRIESLCNVTSLCMHEISMQILIDGDVRKVQKGLDNIDYSCRLSQTQTSTVQHITEADIGRHIAYTCKVKYALYNGSTADLLSDVKTAFIEPTYNKSCESSGDCFFNEMCMVDFCNQSKCECDVDNFYNGKTCEIKKRFEEDECEYCYQCSTWSSFCDTTLEKPVCTCRYGNFYDEATDSCTNIEPCAKDDTYILSREEKVCYSVNLYCTNCTYWEDACTVNDSIPLTFVGNLRQHFIDRLWSYGFYSNTNALGSHLYNEQVVIILSTTFNYTSPNADKPVWYWPDGEVILEDIDTSDWTETKGGEMDSGCLYILYDSCKSTLKASRECNFENIYRGCLIKLPNSYCYENVDERNTTWEYTEGGTTLTKSCPPGYAGAVTRECTTQGVFKLPFYNCTLAMLKNVSDLLQNEAVSAPAALKYVSSEVTQLDDLYIGDLLEIQRILKNAVDLSENTTISEDFTNDYLETASFILDAEKNGNEWESRVENEGKGAENILTNVERFVAMVAKSLMERNLTSLNITKPNIVLQYAVIDANQSDYEGISFPTELQDSPLWNDTTTSSLFLDIASLSDQGVESFTCLLYRNLSKSVPQTLEGQPNTTKIDINSQVVSFQLQPKAPEVLNPELELEFQGFEDMSSSEQHCAFWTLDSIGNGFWSTEGCRKVFGNDSLVKCKCNHLTNFALLISPYVPPQKDEKILGVITIVGCSISGFLILITLVTHLLYWRLMKSDKTILVVCLCVTFIVCYILFLGGVTQTTNKLICTGVAVALHYVFLVLFFLMLAEGTTVFITVSFPLHRQSHLSQFLVTAFVIPLLITAITAGVSGLEGYGNENNCWLSPDTWLFWTFAGPAAAILLANFIIVGVFFQKLFSMKVSASKSLKEKAKMTALAIGVLTPVMGLSWVFGILSVNKETLWLQYIFCLLNGSQGVLIFLFHCVFNKQLRQVITASHERKRTVEEFNSEIKDKIKQRFAANLQTTEESSSSDTRDNCSTDGNENDDNGRSQSPKLPSKLHTALKKFGIDTLEKIDNFELKEKIKQRFAIQQNDKTYDKFRSEIEKDVSAADKEYSDCLQESSPDENDTATIQLELKGEVTGIGDNADYIANKHKLYPENMDDMKGIDRIPNKNDNRESSSVDAKCEELSKPLDPDISLKLKETASNTDENDLTQTENTNQTEGNILSRNSDKDKDMSDRCAFDNSVSMNDLVSTLDPKHTEVELVGNANDVLLTENIISSRDKSLPGEVEINDEETRKSFIRHSPLVMSSSLDSNMFSEQKHCSHIAEEKHARISNHSDVGKRPFCDKRSSMC